MAYENIEISHPNFCIAPQAGTFGTINTSEPTTRLRIKNTAGALIKEYILSSNITNQVLSLEYVGPKNLSTSITGMPFFTLERVNSSTCMIKRWEINETFATLDLKNTIVKSNSGYYYYDVTAMAVEHYERSFSANSPGSVNFVQVNNLSRISNGDTLILGPSTDTDNLGAIEKVTVSFISGGKVYINGTTTYQYVDGDPITFYKNVYLFSDVGFAGQTDEGLMYQIDADSGSILSSAQGAVYQNVDGARWSQYTDTVAAIKNMQLVFIRPYSSYLNWRSMYLSSLKNNNYSYHNVYDVAFDDTTIYKLMDGVTLKDDSGNRSTHTWSTYNYQEDTLLQYTHNVNIYTDRSVLKANDTTTLYVQARDQFGVGLSNVNINFYIDSGDPGGEFDPLNGQDITDVNGEASVDYNSAVFEGQTDISVRADKSSSFTGSQYCWNSIIIYSKIDESSDIGSGYTPGDATLDGRGMGLTQIGYVSGPYYIEPNPGDLLAFQIYDPYQVERYKREESGTEVGVPAYYIYCKSYFTAPKSETQRVLNGDWEEQFVGNFDASYWPLLDIVGGRLDGPPNNPTWTEEPWIDGPIGQLVYNNRGSRINQIGYLDYSLVPGSGVLLTLEAEYLLRKYNYFWTYYDKKGLGVDIEDGSPIPISIDQKGYMDYSLTTSGIYVPKESDLQVDQLKLSLHTHYVDGTPYDYLWTDTTLDQFIFVENAIPAFFSEKNPIDTYIWIRLLPFAFSLDVSTLQFYVREVWSEDDITYDTGYYNIIDLYGPMTGFVDANDPSQGCTLGNPVCYQTFDAGGGTFGLEFLYHPPQEFKHETLVFIHIELYDTAPDPNYIYTDYWFEIIPDFVSPYLENLSPAREENQVPVDTNIYFEIKDDGAGVDIDTLEIYLNSRTLLPTNIEKVSKYHYKVTCDIPKDLYYNKEYNVKVYVQDLSPDDNALRDSYRFYTAYSDAPWFTDFDPALCRRGMPVFRDVSFKVLGGGSGVDLSSLRVQVHDVDVTDKTKITPIVYRIS